MNHIDPTVIIRGDVQLGDGNEILPYSVLIGPLKIGNNNYIGPHVTIGTPGQDTRNPRYDASDAFISIGDNNIIREHTTIQKPCYRESTIIGNSVFIMANVHVPHDAIIEDGVVITPMVVLSGLVRIMEGANLAVACCVHQYSVIGQYSIVAMGSVVTKNVRPFSRYIPGRPQDVNYYAIEKFGFQDYKDEIESYVLNSVSPTSGKLIDIVNRFELMHLESKRGVYL